MNPVHSECVGIVLDLQCIGIVLPQRCDAAAPEMWRWWPRLDGGGCDSRGWGWRSGDGGWDGGVEMGMEVMGWGRAWW